MEIKKLFAKMEQSNQFAEMVGDVPYVFECCFNHYDFKIFLTFKAFKKYLDEEFIKIYTEEILKQDFNVDDNGCGGISFSWSHQYGNVRQEVKCHFSFAIYKEQR